MPFTGREYYYTPCSVLDHCSRLCRIANRVGTTSNSVATATVHSASHLARGSGTYMSSRIIVPLDRHNPQPTWIVAASAPCDNESIGVSQLATSAHGRMCTRKLAKWNAGSAMPSRFAILGKAVWSTSSAALKQQAIPMVVQVAIARAGASQEGA